MTIEFNLARKVPARTDLHAVPVCKGGLNDVEGVDLASLTARGFDGSSGQIMITPGPSGPTALVGMGDADSVDANGFRAAGSAVARSAKKIKKVSTSLHDVLPDSEDVSAAAQSFAEGVALGSYSYGEFKSQHEPNAVQAVTWVGGGKKVSDALARGSKIGSAQRLARDLVNEPGGSLTPAKFARIAEKMAKQEKLTVKVMDGAAIKKARLGGLLGVNRGSEQAPRFVEITYNPPKKRTGFLALVGKGITFDAGGLSIKSGTGMMTMKCDMGGAAAVIGAMAAIRAVNPTVKVTAYVPMTDNMLGGDATRPGDVLKIRNGKTVEVLNTDAEGRLVLADALSLASEAKPDAIIDLATLTGACLVALGPSIAGLMGNDDEFITKVSNAAEAVGEKVWHLPLPSDYRKLIDSPVADIKNIGGPHGGSLTAGLFLQEFVADGIPWAHLDIAGPAWTDAGNGESTKGGTGYGVRTLVRLAQDF